MDNFQNNVDNAQTSLGQPLDVASLDDAQAQQEVKKNMGGTPPPPKNIVERTTKDIVKTGKDLIYGQKDFPETQQRIINKYGDYKIQSIKIGRTPLPSFLTRVLNVVSLGAYNKLVENSPYDKLFHLFMIITLSNGIVIKILLEKNETLNIKVVSNYSPKDAEYMDVSRIPSGLTFGNLLEGVRKIQGSNLFKYSALDNNCQKFIRDVLKGSNMLNDSLNKFIIQDVKSIFKNYTKTRKIINTLTKIGSGIDLVKKNLKL